MFIDPDLLQYGEVWAAAGMWNDVFGIEPHRLVQVSGGVVTDLKRRLSTSSACELGVLLLSGLL